MLYFILKSCSLLCSSLKLKTGSSWLCIKVGRGQGDGDIGTRVWGLGTWGRKTEDLGMQDEGLEDIKYGTRGRVGRGRGDVKYRDAGDAGCE